MSVRQVFAVTSSRLGGGPGAPSFTDEHLKIIADELNGAFANGSVSPYARDYVRLPTLATSQRDALQGWFSPLKQTRGKGQPRIPAASLHTGPLELTLRRIQGKLSG
jgi:hypothetical protein